WFFFFQAEDGIRDDLVTGVQTCALPICSRRFFGASASRNGDGIAAKQFSFKEALCDQRSAACCVEIGCDKTSSGLEICKDGHARSEERRVGKEGRCGWAAYALENE